MADALIAVAVIVAGIVVLNLLQRGPNLDEIARLQAARGSQSTLPTPRASTTSGKPPPGAAAVAREQLTVLNNSRLQGLAAGAARDFRRRGWSIRSVGNTTYRSRITTVFYNPDQEAVARRLMADFPTIRRMLLRPLRLPGRGLTVVVTREYPR